MRISVKLGMAFPIALGLGLASAALAEVPKLVVVVVIDQLRSDQLPRWSRNFLPPRGKSGTPGGFRYLMQEGAYFPLAQYQHLQGLTAVGHATIMSGAYPYQHQIILNEWMDRESGQLIQAPSDERYPIVGDAKGFPVRGISPKNIGGTTFIDELKNSGYQSKAVAISLKERSSVLLGGHRADLALWFNKESASWVSSRYYLPKGELPDWVKAINEPLKARHEDILQWEADGDESGTSLPDNRHLERKPPLDEIGVDFPHQTKTGSRHAILFPFGVQITTDMAIAALESMKLGSGPHTDVLAVSYSSHDSVAHTFGTNSRELEFLAEFEDRMLARLLGSIDQKVGLKNTLVVLTSDHGASPLTEYLQEVKIPAGRIDEDGILKACEDIMVKNYGKPKNGPWMLGYTDLNYYLNPKALRAAGLNMVDVRKKLGRDARMQANIMGGIQYAFTGEDVRERSLPPGLFADQILKTYVEGRSGDIVFIPKPYHVYTRIPTVHVTGYAYDRFVPLIMSGPGIKAGRYGQTVNVVDVAPTLSFLTGTIPPSGSEGRVLSEALKEGSKQPE
ncbi:MAG TPA: alkaline phosphatase family protein [Oligoflexus sp.]|uniref:alkaline phosphatase family protein n=1 Tax=Oligoflexus sp. TaxID=1971216 RepID=UPI002D7FFD0F|nr:alkaline phosphatase family protein [Oligoflexus sp.]HET9239435.1 alkaline phosphatase family protein [Oligoflexus sp.]